jgi:GNAT superfamily N-acetyltransferase
MKHMHTSSIHGGERDPLTWSQTAEKSTKVLGERIMIRAFRAPDDVERCARFVQEHTRVLEDIGVISVIKPDLSWCSDLDVIVLVAEHEVLGMVAGIRVHKASVRKVLPMQRCMEELDSSIPQLFASLVPNGTAEIAGLWNAHRFAGRGIPKLLMEAAVSVANRLGVRTLVTFIAEYVAPYAAATGFVLLDSLDNGGIFEYPVAGIRTHAMVLPDVLTMTNAQSFDRYRIVSLRLRPHQQRQECPKRAVLDVHYELMDPAPCTNEVAGRNLNAA